MWYNCKFLDNNYAVSDDGQVRRNQGYGFDGRIIHEHILRPFTMKNGYKVVDVRYKGRTIRFLVHRLVYCTINNIDINTELVVHHKDHNRSNNCIDNLGLITQRENLHEYFYSDRYIPMSAERRRDVGKYARESLRKEIFQIDIHTNEVIRKFDAIEDVRALGIDPSSVIRVCKGKQKTSYGYYWQYVNMDINKHK